MAHINASIPITLNTTVDDLIEELSRFPGQSKVDVHITPRDRPFESAEKSLRLNYDSSPQPPQPPQSPRPVKDTPQS